MLLGTQGNPQLSFLCHHRPKLKSAGHPMECSQVKAREISALGAPGGVRWSASRECWKLDPSPPPPPPPHTHTHFPSFTRILRSTIRFDGKVGIFKEKESFLEPWRVSAFQGSNAWRPSQHGGHGVTANIPTVTSRLIWLPWRHG